MQEQVAGRKKTCTQSELPLSHSRRGASFLGALKAGYVSVTPLQLDLTAREAMDDLGKWNWK